MPSPTKPRTDSVLHTGMSSARDEAIRQKNKERIEKNRAKADRIVQSSDIFLDWIKREEEIVCDLRDLLKNPDHPDTTVELTARKKQLDSLRKWRREVNKLLGTPEPVMEKDDVTETWEKEAKTAEEPADGK